jgi:hypothetical protein
LIVGCAFLLLEYSRKKPLRNCNGVLVRKDQKFVEENY